MSDENFSGYVLAGGKSSRMGADKAFLKIGGETFIERAVKILKSVCGDQVKIVVNANQKNLVEKISSGKDLVFDVFENRGALGGIHAALKCCSSKFALILAVDLPFVDVDTIKTLAATALAEKEFSAIVPRQNDGRLQPLCGIYRVENCLPEVEKLLSENVSVSMRDFLETVNVKIIEEIVLSENQKIFINVNTPAEYDNLKSAE